jgi:DNA-binding transcriptional LysR family regulator
VRRALRGSTSKNLKHARLPENLGEQMELDQLRYALEVARAGSFTVAATVVHVQQPAISRAVGALEAELGVRIFERSRRNVVATPAGRRILDRAEELLRLAGELRATGERERQELGGTLRFGAASAIAAAVLPDATARFLEVHPRVWPLAFTAPTQAMLEPVDRGELEFALVLHVARRPRELVQTVFARLPFRLVVRADRRRDRATLARFIGSREVEDAATRAYPTLTRLRKRVPEAAIRVSSNDVAAHLGMVRAGIGVSVLPELLVAEDLAAGRFADVLKRELRFPLLLLHRRGRTLSRAATEYLDAVAKTLA